MCKTLLNNKVVDHSTNQGLHRTKSRLALGNNGDADTGRYVILLYPVATI